MSIIKLNSDISTVDKIFHIADIHIRLYKRQQEYLEVFENLYNEISKNFDDKSIIFVGGDIIHTKLEMSAEMVRMVSAFFKRLADIGTTIIIPGNHDANLSNKQRLDPLTPIVELLNHKNLFYLKDTNLYSIGDNIIFSNMSVFDSSEKYILAKDMPDDDRIKIALYHGVIDNVATDTGFRLKSSHITTSFFDGFDICLIGDIHLHQTVQKYNSTNKKPAIVYPSSVIQQNFSENVDNHGMLIWDVNSRTFEFKRIKNSYGYVTIDVEDGKIVNTPEIPEKPHIRIRRTNTTIAQLNECIVNIRQLYNPVEIAVTKQEKNPVNRDTIKIDMSNIRDVKYQNSLIKDYLGRNFNLEDSLLLKIFELNKEFNKLLPTEEIARNILWKPKTFKFSNMFSYGEDNIIDFSKMGGIIGLFAGNAQGKTSLIESLLFCLFDKCSKTFKASHILNTQKNSFSCEFNFEISGQDYFIKKVAKKSKSDKVSVKIEFWKIDENGNTINLNGDERRDTASVIRSYIGTYDDFVLTAVSSQVNSNTNFIDLKQTDRKELLAQFMDIMIFDQLHTMASKKMDSYSVLLEKFKSRNFDFEMSQADENIKNYSNKKMELENKKLELKNSINKLNNSIIELSQKLVKIDTSIIDVNALEQKSKQIQRNIDSIKLEIQESSEFMLTQMTKYKDTMKKIEVFKSADIESEYEKLKVLNSNLNATQRKIDELKIHINHKLEKIKNLGKLEYNPDCTYCMNNVFVKDAIQTKSDLMIDKESYESLMSKLNSINNDIKLKSNINKDYEEYMELVKLSQKIKTNTISLNASKQNSELKLTALTDELRIITERIDLYYKSKDFIENNKVVNTEIASLKSNVISINSELNSLEKDLVNVSANILFSEKQRESILSDIASFREIEVQFDSYKYYIEAVKRDGIPYELISKAVPVIEQEINNSLNQIVNFSILLDLDGKNINANIVYNDDKYWPIELTSGMERFVSGLAIRSALLSISNLPRPTFLCVDEGFSSLDADKASDLPALLEYLRNQFEFVLVISHLDFMRDYVDTSLDLKQIDGFSKISYQ